MAFGLFKKKHTADIIFSNGHVYTQDPAFPWASAVACRNGKILAVGDVEAMDEIISEDETEIIDLKGRYLFPGFMETHGTEILKAFEDQFLTLDPVWDLDTVLEAVREYAEETDNETIFAYGYGEHILEDYEDTEEVLGLLDEIEPDRPVVILGISGVHCWLNTLASEIYQTIAEDEGMQYVSVDYILHTLSPLDYEAIERNVMESSDEMCDRGITSVFPLNTPDYFRTTYQNCLIAMIGENIPLKQRLFSSIYINRPLPPELILHKLSEARTNCSELAGIITCDFLKLEVSENEQLACFPQDSLKTVCLAAAEHGCNLHLDALDKASAEQALETFAFLRGKGCKNNTFVLAAEEGSVEADESLCLTTWPTNYLNESVYSHADSVSHAIDLLTIEAAELLGVSKEFGSIEQGKRADFTIFEENPLKKNLRYFSGMHAAMTVVDGQIVYDLDEACDEEMYDLITSMRL